MALAQSGGPPEGAHVTPAAPPIQLGLATSRSGHAVAGVLPAVPAGGGIQAAATADRGTSQQAQWRQPPQQAARRSGVVVRPAGGHESQHLLLTDGTEPRIYVTKAVLSILFGEDIPTKVALYMLTAGYPFLCYGHRSRPHQDGLEFPKTARLPLRELFDLRMKRGSGASKTLVLRVQRMECAGVVCEDALGVVLLEPHLITPAIMKEAEQRAAYRYVLQRKGPRARPPKAPGSPGGRPVKQRKLQLLAAASGFADAAARSGPPTAGAQRPQPAAAALQHDRPAPAQLPTSRGPPQQLASGLQPVQLPLPAASPLPGAAQGAAWQGVRMVAAPPAADPGTSSQCHQALLPVALGAASPQPVSCGTPPAPVLAPSHSPAPGGVGGRTGLPTKASGMTLISYMLDALRHMNDFEERNLYINALANSLDRLVRGV